MAVLPSLNSIRAGLTILVNSEPYLVLESDFMRTAQRKPVMRTKLRNLLNGKVLEQTFKPGDKVEEADMARLKASFLYADESQAHFMNQETFEQFDFPRDALGGQIGYLKDGLEVNIINFNGNPITVELPKKVALKVVEAPPSVRGDTAGNVTKQIKLETGVTVNAPLFIKEGEEIIVNTDTGQYVERA
ncbi:MAG: elongation factor P [Candidatus Veblenbacteria bacterium]|nr:elongation factor P [Candidatus Veblenbacteria bacterium]MDZ4229916.1 elongation factor P [Candidatus Veblenbacteria bacterium]